MIIGPGGVTQLGYVKEGAEGRQQGRGQQRSEAGLRLWEKRKQREEGGALLPAGLRSPRPSRASCCARTLTVAARMFVVSRRVARRLYLKLKPACHITRFERYGTHPGLYSYN